jgi:prepilin-type N-terminal cleavage/methylation domain-containing protein
VRALRRSGFTLVELLVGLVVLGIFAAMVVAVVRGAARTAARATQFLVADRALQSLRVFTQQELRNGTSGDVTLLTPTRVALARPIGEATVCTDSAGAVAFANTAWIGTRAPEAHRDEAWLLTDAIAGTWLRLSIDSIVSGRCPIGGASATRLLLPAHAGAALVMRVMEPVELSAYPSGGSDWFGLTPASHVSAVQPFAGPLTPLATHFARAPDHLDVMVSPRGAAAVVVQVPLGSAP